MYCFQVLVNKLGRRLKQPTDRPGGDICHSYIEPQAVQESKLSNGFRHGKHKFVLVNQLDYVPYAIIPICKMFLPFVLEVKGLIPACLVSCCLRVLIERE